MQGSDEREIERGMVVWASVPDRSGGTIKLRPAVVIDINASGELLLVACATTKFDPANLQYEEIKLPHGHALTPSRTGMTTASVIRCDWLLKLCVSEIKQIAGAVPEKLHTAILDRIRNVLELQKGGSSPQKPKD